ARDTILHTTGTHGEGKYINSSEKGICKCELDFDLNPISASPTANNTIQLYARFGSHRITLADIEMSFQGFEKKLTPKNDYPDLVRFSLVGWKSYDSAPPPTNVQPSAICAVQPGPLSRALERRGVFSGQVQSNP